MSSNSFKLGFLAAPIDAPGSSDEQLYAALMREVEVGSDLGFDAVWMIEHHFVDYFPTPNPLLALAHVAGRFPHLELGTAVLVTPWHNPLRLAEDIAMLSHLTSRRLHIGMGRGTAKYEYDAFGVEMGEARQRFAETLEIVRHAFAGESFVYAGEHLRVDTPVRLRPRPREDQITVYGAIGSASSATVMGAAGVPPICTSIGDFEAQRACIESWRESAGELGGRDDLELPIMVNCIVADTDEQAIAHARTHMTRFMQAQLDHYQFEKTDWERIKGYEQWAQVGRNFKRLTIPENIDGWTTHQLIGSPDTVRERVEQLVELGFNHIILQAATPGVPVELRREWLTRFVEDVAAPAGARGASA